MLKEMEVFKYLNSLRTGKITGNFLQFEVAEGHHIGISCGPGKLNYYMDLKAFVNFRLFSFGCFRPRSEPGGPRWPRHVISHREHGVGQPAFEVRVVAILLEQFRIVLHDARDNVRQHFVVLDPGILPVGILHCIPIGGIRRNLLRDVLGDEPPHPVAALPRRDRSEAPGRLEGIIPLA